MLILRRCRLIPALTEDYEGTEADILLDGGRIAEIRPTGHDFGVEAETIDVGFGTLLPGLMDIHAHLNLYSQNVLEALVQTPEEAAFDGYAFAKEYIRQGYTLVRDCGSSYGVANAIRDAIAKGVLPGPRVISCGQILTPTESGNKWFEKMYVEADGADEVLRTCRKLYQGGAEFIKVMTTGAFYNEGGEPGQTIVTEAELRTMVETAASRGSYVAAHCHGTEAIKLCIRCGVRTLEHCSLVDDEGIEMLRRSRESFMVPTIAIDKVPYDEPESIPEHMWPKVNALTELSHSCIKKAYQAGVLMGWGSDLDRANFVKYPAAEFIARKVMLGFDNVEMLRQATINSARILGLDGELGSIKVGKTADLIVVPGKPDEDIYAMKEVTHVFRGGMPVDLR